MIASSNFYAFFCVLANEGIGDFFNIKAYLPATGDTVTTKAVPPGRGSPLHFGVADPRDYPKICFPLGAHTSWLIPHGYLEQN